MGIFFLVLTGFDREISSNRDRAMEALRNIDDIQNKIDEANNKTAVAQNALGTAQSIAIQANDKAQQARNIAEGIQTVRGRMRCAQSLSVGSESQLAS